MVRKVACPSCGRPVQWSEASTHRPFCSQRCRLLDLGDWLSAAHHIPGPRLEDESLDELDPSRRPANDEGGDG